MASTTVTPAQPLAVAAILGQHRRSASAMTSTSQQLQPAQGTPRTQALRSQYASEHLELAARERTFDGAYTRTALNAIATGIFVSRIFYYEFGAIALTLIAFGILVWVAAMLRRHTLDREVWKLNRELGFGHNDDAIELADLSRQNGGGGNNTNGRVIRDERGQLLRDDMDRVEKGVSIASDTAVTSSTTHIASDTTRASASSRPANTIVNSLIPDTQAETRMVEARLRTRQSVRRTEGFEVVVPQTPAMQQMSAEYYQWRAERERPLEAPYFKTSGNTVLFIGMLTFITEVIIFVQLVLLK